MIKPRRYRYQNTADASAGGGSSTLMTDGANTTPADTSTAPATTPDATANTAADGANADATQQTPEQIAAAQAEADATAAAELAKAPPEKYEFKAPEGVTLDADALGEFEAFAKELKLSQGDAQKVADIGAKMSQKWAANQAEAIQTAAAEWAAAATADKEYGGDKLSENLGVAKKALDAFGTPELRTLLNDSRLGNHPEVIRFMVRAGKAISEDRMVTGGAGPATAATSTAKALYPNMA